jgi:hypothetical protein
MELWRAPPFLIIQLKRSQFGKKNTDSITIPDNLNLKNYMNLSSKSPSIQMTAARSIVSIPSAE